MYGNAREESVGQSLERGREAGNRLTGAPSHVHSHKVHSELRVRVDNYIDIRPHLPGTCAVSRSLGGAPRALSPV